MRISYEYTEMDSVQLKITQLFDEDDKTHFIFI